MILLPITFSLSFLHTAQPQQRSRILQNVFLRLFHSIHYSIHSPDMLMIVVFKFLFHWISQQKTHFSRALTYTHTHTAAKATALGGSFAMCWCWGERQSEKIMKTFFILVLFLFRPCKRAVRLRFSGFILFFKFNLISLFCCVFMFG